MRSVSRARVDKRNGMITERELRGTCRTIKTCATGTGWKLLGREPSLVSQQLKQPQESKTRGVFNLRWWSPRKQKQRRNKTPPKHGATLVVCGGDDVVRAWWRRREYATAWLQLRNATGSNTVRTDRQAQRGPVLCSLRCCCTSTVVEIVAFRSLEHLSLSTERACLWTRLLAAAVAIDPVLNCQLQSAASASERPLQPAATRA